MVQNPAHLISLTLCTCSFSCPNYRQFPHSLLCLTDIKAGWRCCPGEIKSTSLLLWAKTAVNCSLIATGGKGGGGIYGENMGGRMHCRIWTSLLQSLSLSRSSCRSADKHVSTSPGSAHFKSMEYIFGGFYIQWVVNEQPIGGGGGGGSTSNSYSRPKGLQKILHSLKQ